MREKSNINNISPPKPRKFWNWVKNEDNDIRTLYINGVIAEESWYGDEVTPALFRLELNSGSGDIEIWVNSVGGDCVAAAQIYNMLMDYPHNVTVKIDGIAASAASVISMAGTKVLMSPVSVMFVHNPLTVAIGDSEEMQKAIAMLAMHGVDYIFHAAALKQVPSCEFFPMEAVKTNVIGTDNVLTAAIDEGVKTVICLSTDKAAYPVNAMGTSKAMMEKVIVAKSRTVSPDKTKICCTRYGNVMCSRGSVIPLWIQQIREGKPITITEPTMTRFIMSLDEAVDLVLFAFEHGTSGDILVQKAPACTIETQAQAVKELFDPERKTDIKVIGIRHGEKMYETLLTNEECAHAIDLGNFYRVPCDKRDLNYDNYFTKGETERNKLTEFNSNNTELLNVDQVKEKLMTLQYIKDELAKGDK